MLKPIHKTSLAASVFEQLRALILSGELATGDSLPAERQLSESLGVNRSAVREALKRLEQAGLVAIHHGGKTQVLDYRRHGGPGLLSALLVENPLLMDDLVTFCAAVLPEICRLAADGATAGQVNRMEMLDGLMKNGDDADRRDLFTQYVHVLVDASQNLVFRLVFNRVDLVFPDGRVPSLEGSDLTNAIAAGDTRGAALAARALLR